MDSPHKNEGGPPDEIPISTFGIQSQAYPNLNTNSQFPFTPPFPNNYNNYSPRPSIILRGRGRGYGHSHSQRPEFGNNDNPSNNSNRFLGSNPNNYGHGQGGTGAGFNKGQYAPSPRAQNYNGNGGYRHQHQQNSNPWNHNRNRSPRPNFRGQFHQPRFQGLRSRNPSPRFSQNGAYTYPNTNESAKGGKYFCDTCDKGFPDQEMFDQHKAEHIICKLDGCQFTACSKIVLKHIKMQHSTNLFNKIQGLDTPESIEKWRQERKQNFPSASNMAQKAAKKEAFRQRGERAGATKGIQRLKPLRYPIVAENRNRNRRGRDRNPNPRACFAGEFEMTRSPPNFIVEKNTSEILVLDKYYSEVKVSEKGKLVGKNLKIWNKDNSSTGETNGQSETDSENEEVGASANGIITDDEEPLIHDPVPPAPLETSEETQSTIAAILGSLVTYSSDSEGQLEDGEVNEDEEPPESAPISKVPTVAIQFCYDSQTLPTVRSKRIQSLLESGGKKPKKNPNPRNTKSQKFQDNDSKSTAGEQQRQIQKPKVRVKCPPPYRPRPRPPTLLRRLLDDEICKERNYVLQACRFIVRNSFFEPKPEVEDNPPNSKQQQVETDLEISSSDLVVKKESENSHSQPEAETMELPID